MHRALDLLPSFLAVTSHHRSPPQQLPSAQARNSPSTVLVLRCGSRLSHLENVVRRVHPLTLAIHPRLDEDASRFDSNRLDLHRNGLCFIRSVEGTSRATGGKGDQG
jgi:hypothetical protein